MFRSRLRLGLCPTLWAWVLPLIGLSACRSVLGIGDGELPVDAQASSGGDSGDSARPSDARPSGVELEADVLAHEVHDAPAESESEASPETGAEGRRWTVGPDHLSSSDFNVSGGTAVDRRTGLVWPLLEAGGPYTYQEATSACASAGRRLPSLLELLTLVDFTVEDPAIVRGVFLYMDGRAHFTSTAYAGDPQSLWSLRLFWGQPQPVDREDALGYYLQCVSGSPLGSVGSARYQVRGDIVRDLETGLLWQRATRPGLTSVEAESACKDQVTTECSGFRVPSFRELMSIADHTKRAPALDPGVFSGGANDLYWSSTVFVGAPENRSAFDSADGRHAILRVDSGKGAVRCVCDPGASTVP